MLLDGGRPWIVAEISANHQGDYAKARALVDAAAYAGADAVKFQLYTPDDMALPDSPPLATGPWAGRTLYDLYTEAMTPRDWFPDLFALARAKGLVPFASVFNPDDVGFLESLDCAVYKIASAEIGWTALIDAVGAAGKPLIISTGMATPGEIARAVAAAQPSPTILLHCVSAYPTKVTDAHLHRMDVLRQYPGVTAVGVSDHSVENDLVPIAATAKGSAVIEKHLMLPGTMPLDARFSLTPGAFTRMVRAVKETWEACQPGTDVEGESRQFKRRPIGGRWLRG